MNQVPRLNNEVNEWITNLNMCVLFSQKSLLVWSTLYSTSGLIWCCYCCSFLSIIIIIIIIFYSIQFFYRCVIYIMRCVCLIWPQFFFYSSVPIPRLTTIIVHNMIQYKTPLLCRQDLGLGMLGILASGGNDQHKGFNKIRVTQKIHSVSNDFHPI